MPTWPTGWKRDVVFEQTKLVVSGSPRSKPGEHNPPHEHQRNYEGDTFCNALVVGWLAERSGAPLGKAAAQGLGYQLNRLHDAQVTYRQTKLDIGGKKANNDLYGSKGFAAVAQEMSRPGVDPVDELQRVIWTLKKHSDKLLIEFSSSKEGVDNHAVGVRLNAPMMEFFDPNHGMYSGELPTFPHFLAVYYERHFAALEFSSFRVTALSRKA